MKAKRKTIPVNIYNTSAVESWLREMAGEGLEVIALTDGVAEFNEGEPHRAIFYAMPKDKKASLTPEEKETYEKEGWIYIDSLRDSFYVFRNTEDYPKPFPKNRDEEYDCYIGMKKRMLRRTVVSLMTMVLLLAALGAVLILNFSDIVLDGDFDVPVSSVLIVAGTFFAFMQSLNSYKCIDNKIENIDYIGDAFTPYDSALKWRRIELAASIVLLGVSFYPLIKDYLEEPKNEVVMAEAVEGRLPFLPIEAIEGEESSSKEIVVGHNENIFAPVQWTTTQIGKDGGYIFDDDDDRLRFDGSLVITYAELSTEALASVFIASCLRQYDERTEAEAIGDTQVRMGKGAFDESWLLQRDERILQVVYSGEGDITPCLEEFSALLDKGYSLSWEDIEAVAVE